MSPNVGNFVHDLVEMAKAMETLPQVQAELEQTKIERQSLLDRIDRINADLEQSRNYAATLEQRNHDLEVQRDDAELRFLELDEKAHSVMGMLIDFEGKAKGARLILDPPKPQPEPEAQPQPPVSEAVHSIEPQSQGQGESHPTNEHAHSTEGQSASGANVGTTGSASNEAPQPPASQDQSAVNPPAQPSANTSDTPSDAGQAHATPTDAGSTGGEGSGDKPQPYAGKRYYNYPVYLPLQDWIAGGGTEEDYNWRPASGQTF